MISYNVLYKSKANEESRHEGVKGDASIS